MFKSSIVNYTSTSSNNGCVSQAFSGFFSLNNPGNWDNVSAYKSVFLDRYGVHFAAAQYTVISRNVGYLLQNTAPDLVTFGNAGLSALTLPTGSFRTAGFPAGIDSLNPYNIGTKRAVTRDGIWRIVHGLRYGWRLRSNREVIRPFKNRFTGFYRWGRKLPTVSHQLRYGASVRSIFWWYFTKEVNTGTTIRKSRLAPFTLENSTGISSGAFFVNRAGTGISGARQRNFNLFVALSGVNHLRTVWYSTNRYLASFFAQDRLIGVADSKNLPRSSAKGSSVFDYERILQYSALTGGFGPFGNVRGDLISRSVDSSTYSHFIQRRHARHANYRIVVGRYERKLWNYKKTRHYWRFMRWVSHFYFKGLSYLKFFTLRVDVFLVNHLRVRNIALSRLFIKGGHAFVGDTACYNPAHHVERYDVVSLSREVVRWMHYRSADARRVSKQSPNRSSRRKYLSFARSSEFGGIFHGKMNTFAVVHGSYNNLVNSEEFRTSNSWSSFGYFQGQRVIASAWW